MTAPEATAGMIPDDTPLPWASPNGDGAAAFGRPDTGLTFTPWAQLKESAPPEPDWVLEGYVARGLTTLAAGKPKVGKSEWSCALAQAVDAEASSFLGRKVSGGPVIYVSEEGATTLAPKLTPSSRSVALTRDAAWPKPLWADLIYAGVAEAERIGAVLLVIDSLAFWAMFTEGQEKDAGATQAAMDALTAATGSGLAVLVVHHQRKGGGEEGDAVRGSGAIFGATDILVELERVGEDSPPTHRRLVAIGRSATTPPVLVIDRDPATGAWRAVGQVASRREAATLGMRDRILEAMPEAPETVTEAELAELVEADKRKVSRPLRELVAEGLVSRTGAGQRGNPYRYEKVPRKVPRGGAAKPAEKVPLPYRGGTFSSNSAPAPGAARGSFSDEAGCGPADVGDRGRLTAPPATPDEERRAERLVALYDDEEPQR